MSRYLEVAAVEAPLEALDIQPFSRKECAGNDISHKGRMERLIVDDDNGR